MEARREAGREGGVGRGGVGRNSMVGGWVELCCERTGALQSRRGPPSTLGYAGVGQDGLSGLKDRIFPAPTLLVWNAGPQHLGPAAGIESCCEILLRTRRLAP